MGGGLVTAAGHTGDVEPANVGKSWHFVKEEVQNPAKNSLLSTRQRLLERGCSLCKQGTHRHQGECLARVGSLKGKKRA